MHTISLYVRSIALSALLLIALPVLASQNTVLVLGDSLSAAYGVPSETAWVELLRDRIESQDLDWTVVNASISGETTDGGLRRLPGLLEAHELQAWRLLYGPPAPYTRERFDNTYHWMLGYPDLVISGATYEDTVDNRAWE